VVSVTGQQVREAYDAADPKAAEAEAEHYWLGPAKSVDAPRVDVVRAARMYLAIKEIMIRERAQGIAIHCLSALSRQMMDAQGYPCLAFSKLDDLGLVSGCQADMDDTLTKLIVQYAFGLPGFLANTYFDTGNSVVMYDHCTSATMMDGPRGDRAPFVVTTHHTETGAVPHVEMRVGQPITIAKLTELDTMLVSSGKIKGIPEGICRTTIAVEVPDLPKMYENWVSPAKGDFVKTGNLVETVHRIVFYGDHVQNLKDLSTLMGLRVVEEG
jgi:L-fucose isomerase-like protein